jgi:hypothetical protein
MCASVKSDLHRPSCILFDVAHNIGAFTPNETAFPSRAEKTPLSAGPDHGCAVAQHITVIAPLGCAGLTLGMLGAPGRRLSQACVEMIARRRPERAALCLAG